MRILFAGGGSIGHIAPSVAVWRAVQKHAPDAECHFVCCDRAEEAEFLRKEKISFTQLPGRKLSLLRPWSALSALRSARTMLLSWKPDVIFCKGGSLGIPVAIAARGRDIPVVIHESDAVMGRSNAFLAKWASVVCLGFCHDHDSKLKTQNSKLIFTGNPTRQEVTHGSRDEGLRITGLSGTRPVLLVMGGSQGALALNDALRQHLAELLKIVDVIHLTGKGKPSAGNFAGYWSKEFAQEELPHLYAATDLALARSGAGSISELAACGIPSILVPLRGLAQDHQLHNAMAAEHRGGCMVLQQENLDESLVPAVTQLATNTEKRATMSRAIRLLCVPDAAERIAKVVLESGGHAT